MSRLYRFGQFLALLQTCCSQCFDPKTIIVSNFENSSLPGFILFRNADIAMCMMICFKFKLCRSVDWIKDKKTCRLNTRFDLKKDSILTTYVEKENFPVHLAGDCLNNDCTEDAICIGGKCVPVLKEKIYKDCSEILKRDPSKRGQNGIYFIYPDIRREVFCDMTTDGGGWTTIQKRQDGDVDFNRTWNEYKEGFGNASKNYWLGNDAIYALTRDENQTIRVDLQRHNGEQAYAVYSTFYIGEEDNKYTLTVSGYRGTAGDSLGPQSGMKFTTKDQDNDMYSGNCAINNHGGWWFKKCHPANLNGQYAQSAVSAWPYIIWYNWKGTESLKQTVMMIRNKNQS